MTEIVRRGMVRGLWLGLVIVSLPGAMALGKIIGRVALGHPQGFYLHD